MKTQLSILSFLLINLVLISSLLLSKTTIAQTLTFDLKKLPEKSIIKLSEIGAIEIKYIPLETTPECIMPQVSKIIFTKNYLLTQYYNNINMFRLDGSFVTKIGTEGKGPYEFTVVHDVDINPQNESIYIVDGWQQKLLVFNKEGKIVRTFKAPLSAAINFKFTNDGILSYNYNIEDNIHESFILLDTTGKIIKNYPNKYFWKRSGRIQNFFITGENLFYRYNGRLIKKEMYSDTLYTYKNRRFRPYLIINVGDLRITPEIRTEPADNIVMKVLIPMNLFEFGHFIYYEFTIPVKGHTETLAFIGSKKNDYKAIFNPEKDLINDLDGGPNIWPKTIKDDKTIVSWIEALELKKYVASDAFKNANPKYPQKKKELEKFASSLREMDNPILILIKTK